MNITKTLSELGYSKPITISRVPVAKLKDIKRKLPPASDQVLSPIKKSDSILSLTANKTKKIFQKIAQPISQICTTIAQGAVSVLNFSINAVSYAAANAVGAVSQMVRPISPRAADKINTAANAIRNLGKMASEGAYYARAALPSILYAGPSLKPGEIRKKPTQTGTKGTTASIDSNAFNEARPGTDVSALAYDVLKANAPIVRQFKHDAYPISSTALTENASPDGNHLDLEDSFTNNPKASHNYSPTTYATAEKIDDDHIKLTYTRYYPQSYLPTGPTYNLPGEPEHEGDAEVSSFIYNVKSGEIVGASVSKHGNGHDKIYSQSKIEFKDGHPVINVALGSHATGLASGLEEAPSKYVMLYDNYPSARDVSKNRAVELTMKPENIIVVGKDATTQTAYAESDRWAGTLDAERRRGSSGTFFIPG